ncbi:MAG: hypothetical protein IJH34_07245, partial [Romboutsia sp.]|nr:hypothetical protein [Romboutsia sp.]
ITRDFTEVLDAEKENNKQNEIDEKDKLLQMSTATLGIVGAIVAVIVVLVIILISKKKKGEQEEEETFSEINNLQEQLDNLQKEDDEDILRYITDSNERTLEDEVKIYAQDKPDQVKEIIKTWLNDEQQ